MAVNEAAVTLGSMNEQDEAVNSRHAEVGA